MDFSLKHLLAPLPLPEPVKRYFLDPWEKKLEQEFLSPATDTFLELLLKGMEWNFLLYKDFRRNIEGFAGRYVFETGDSSVAASIVFKNGHMKVGRERIKDYDIKVTFKDAPALRRFLFPKNQNPLEFKQDVLESLLKNEVQTEGNLNYLFKFGFMARDLLRRIGIQP